MFKIQLILLEVSETMQCKNTRYSVTLAVYVVFTKISTLSTSKRHHNYNHLPKRLLRKKTLIVSDVLNISSKCGNYSNFSLLSILHGKPLMVNTQTLFWTLNKQLLIMKTRIQMSLPLQSEPFKHC